MGAFILGCSSERTFLRELLLGVFILGWVGRLLIFGKTPRPPLAHEAQLRQNQFSLNSQGQPGRSALLLSLSDHLLGGQLCSGEGGELPSDISSWVFFPSFGNSECTHQSEAHHRGEPLQEPLLLDKDLKLGISF